MHVFRLSEDDMYWFIQNVPTDKSEGVKALQQAISWIAIYGFFFCSCCNTSSGLWKKIFFQYSHASKSSPAGNTDPPNRGQACIARRALRETSWSSSSFIFIYCQTNLHQNTASGRKLRRSSRRQHHNILFCYGVFTFHKWPLLKRRLWSNKVLVVYLLFLHSFPLAEVLLALPPHLVPLVIQRFTGACNVISALIQEGQGEEFQPIRRIPTGRPVALCSSQQVAT